MSRRYRNHLGDLELRESILFVLNDYCPKYGWVSKRGLSMMIGNRGRLSKRQMRMLDYLIEIGAVKHGIGWQGRAWYHVYKPRSQSKEIVMSANNAADQEQNLDLGNPACPICGAPMAATADGYQCQDCTREALGMVVRQAWINFCLEIGDHKPSHLTPWQALSDNDKEVDRQIGEVILKFVVENKISLV